MTPTTTPPPRSHTKTAVLSDSSNNAAPVAIITGAGGGVGQATARLMANAGYRLMLTSRTQAKLNATRESIVSNRSVSPSSPPPAHTPHTPHTPHTHASTFPPPSTTPDIFCQTIVADLTIPDQSQRVVDETVERFGRIDALVAVAGGAVMGSIDQITPDAWQHTIDVNVSYVVHMTARAWPIFQRQQSGIIGVVSSMASVDPFPDFGMYAPAKAALNMFMRCAADEGQAINLRTVAIAPGAIETPMLRNLFDTDRIPADKTLAPQDVAQLLVDCLTGKRAFDSGQTIMQPNS